MSKVVIIGAGIYGLLCAYYLLNQRNITIEIYDEAIIPNPTSASCGRHRLIHPHSTHMTKESVAKATQSLQLWTHLLRDIKCDAFLKTGVLAVSPSTFTLEGTFFNISDATEVEELASSFFGAILPKYTVIFKDFGLLLADKILHTLMNYLRKHPMVSIYQKQKLLSLDSDTKTLFFENGVSAGYGTLILAMGTGIAGLIDRTPYLAEYIAHLGFRKIRCYVAYIAPKGGAHESTHPSVSWASLGIGDMWGMPPVKDIPMKLGCGDFSHEVAIGVNEGSQYNAARILNKYQQLFPVFENYELVDHGVNHWTKIETCRPFVNLRDIYILTSDNGAGFKFAPYVASSLVSNDDVLPDSQLFAAL